MPKSGGSVSTGAATRLVYTIGLLKWLALVAIAGGVLLANALGGTDNNPFAGALVFIVWLYGLVAGLAVYVLFGWLQQTLLMLVGIAKNTASGADLDFLRHL